MFRNVLQAFFRKAFYGVAASAVGWMLGIVKVTSPADPAALQLWQLGVIPAVTGLAGAISRVISYNPTRAAR
jgi:hypothetical protein